MSSGMSGHDYADAASDETVASAHLSRDAWEDLLAQAEKTSYVNRFTAVRADIVWRPALLDGTGLLLNPKPTALGSQTAIVVGPDGTTSNAGTVHTDALGLTWPKIFGPEAI